MKRQMEEQLKNNEIEELASIQQSIDDPNIGSNPLSDQIDLCDQLKLYCQRQMDKLAAPESTPEELKEQPKEAVAANDLNKQLQKGALLLASKQPDTSSLFGGLQSKKGKKQRKRTEVKDQFVDFELVKKFSKLKISAPLNEEDYKRTMGDLDELKVALVYWGKIILRQNKIRFIKGARKISVLEEYQKMAEEEEQFINQEKLKFDDEDAEKKTKLNLEKLKIAQMLDREIRMSKAWDQEDEDDDDDEQDDQRQGKAKQARRPNNKKFTEIMKDDQAFPSLEEPEEAQSPDQAE